MKMFAIFRNGKDHFGTNKRRKWEHLSSYIKDDDFNTWYYFKILLKFVIFLNGKIFLGQTKEESVKIFLGLRGYLISV